MTDDLLAHIATATVAVLDRPSLSDNACILGTRVVIEAAKAFGLDLYPKPVAAHAWNRKAWDLSQSGEHIDQSTLPDDAWSVCIDPEAPNANLDPKGYVAHLVAIDRTSNRLVDVTAVQMHRPQHNLIVAREPVLLPLRDDWSSRHPIYATDGPDEEWNTLLVYWPVQRTSAIDRFRTTKNWKTDYRPLAAEVIRTVRAEQAAA
jgi:hypothetical protein